MKILFDARWINTESPDGITRFSRELIKALAKIINLTLLVCDKRQLEGLPKLDYHLTNRPNSPKEIMQAKRLNKLHFDVVYTPHYLFGGNGREFKLVRTVLDLIPFNYRSKNSNLIWNIFHSNKIAFKRLINDSDELVTISNTVKKELKNYTKTKISVVYNAPLNISTKNEGDTNNIIYIGRYEPYKNVSLLVKAMDDLPNYKLILIGHCTSEEKAILLSGSQSRDRIDFVGSINDKEYLNFLKHAFCLATASKAEGFGLPIVEAMQAGCPVVCSDIEIFREIASDAALFFNNDNPEDFAEKIIYLQSEKIRQKITKAGIDAARKFSWRKSAYKLKSILSDVD